MRQSLMSAAILLSACAPVSSTDPPTFTDIGIGRVLSVSKAVEDTGESQSGRIIIGALTGGIAGIVAASGAEADLGHARLFQYCLRMAGGTKASVRSFSIAASGDCVKLARPNGRPDFVMERIDPSACEANVGGD